jgi:hypothetical protein
MFKFIICLACGLLWVQAASAQESVPEVINPTVLAPPAADALPEGHVTTGDQNTKRNGAQSMPPHANRAWHNAVPQHRSHRHVTPFINDHGSIRISYARGSDTQHSRGCGEDRAG